MANDPSQPDNAAEPLAVLFADIAGSTRIYETYGDVIARDATAACIDIMVEVASRFGGRLIKTIGDEAMIVFDDAAKVIMASNEMQMAVQQAGDQGRFQTGPLRVKIGLHYGIGREEETDVFGEATLVATQLVNMAKADQILASSATLDEVPPALRVGSRMVERTLVDGVSGEIDVYEMIWEVSEMTQMADIRPERPRVQHERLRLKYKGREYIADAANPVVTIGRVEGNKIVVETDLTSRQHAEIELTRGRFQLSDNSSNGTMITNASGATQTLRRDKAMLDDTGTICVGGSPEDNPGGVIEFACE